MSKRALLVVDLQNEYWPTGNFPLLSIEATAANAAGVMAHARESGDLVVNIHHEIPGGSIFVPGSGGVQINEAALLPGGEIDDSLAAPRMIPPCFCPPLMVPPLRGDCLTGKRFRLPDARMERLRP